MAKRAASTATQETIPASVGHKLRKLVIKNFGCIGSTGVEIDLDDVVVLVGRNNTGKSTILRAYDVLFSSSKPKLTIEDFPRSCVDENNLPEIELHTRVTDELPGSKWVNEESIVRERWTWDTPNTEAERQGFDVTTGEWSGQVPWGAANVANTRRPRPHRIETFASPEKQTESVTKLLLTSLQTVVKTLPKTVEGDDGNSVRTDYGNLLESLATVQTAIVEQVQEQIEHAQEQLTQLIQNVFQGYKIEFDAKAQEDLSSCLNFFKPGAVLRMGPSDGHMSAAEKQGSGARRTLMWAALKYAAEKSSENGSRRDNLLLMDEPELCLHPNAVREACSVLYDLPGTGRWQVMVTTHSPAFIDLSRDNTTVVRVERDSKDGVIHGTTVFRPEKALLSQDEKEELKMLNLCDPHLCEFFFGGRTVVVEGDTEYTAFKYILDKYPDDEKLRDVHIVRARGKATICLVSKILNQFGARYAVLHDCDTPKVMRKKRNSVEREEITSPAWTNNTKIRDALKIALEESRARLIAMVPNFEGAFLEEEVSSEKPVHIWHALRSDEGLCERVRCLLYALLDFNEVVPEQCAEWREEEGLLERWTQFNSKAIAE